MTEDYYSIIAKRLGITREEARRHYFARVHALRVPIDQKRTVDWQGTPYRTDVCRECRSEIKGPESRMPWLLKQHALRCAKSSAAERTYRKAHGRWPAKKETHG